MADKSWRNHVTALGGGARERILRPPTEVIRRAGESSADLARKAAEGTARGARGAWTRVRDAVHRQIVEDEGSILEQCPIFLSALEQRRIYESDPEAFRNLYNLPIRPLVSGALLAGAGLGALAFEKVLSRLTRHVFDGDQLVGGWAAGSLAGLVGPDTTAAVNRFMDTVPGASHMGGGWLHRVQHGHDLASVAEVYAEHGFGGAVQALYHIFGRDFFTPAGIPVLPAGSREAHEFLTTRLGLQPVQAADLISLNFIELLGGIVTIVGLIRLVQFATSLRDNVRVANLVKRTTDALQAEDFLTAAALAGEALAIRPNDGTLRFLLASTHHRSGNALQAHIDFREVCKWTARKEPAHDLGGASVSFRGLAAIGALATSDALAKSDEYRSSWRDHVVELARAGVTAFESVAHRLVDRRLLERLGERSLLPGRHLSAAANYYLAGQIAGGSLLLPDRDLVLERVARKYDECLAQVERRLPGGAIGESVRFLREFGQAQLAALPAQSSLMR